MFFLICHNDHQDDQHHHDDHEDDPDHHHHLPCLTKPFILLLLLGYLCTIYTQNKHYCSNKIAFSLQKFINLARHDIPFLWLSGIGKVGAPFYKFNLFSPDGLRWIYEILAPSPS